MMNIGTVLRGLYESGICGGVLWLYDGGWGWHIGDKEGAMAAGLDETLDIAAQAMHEAALKHYPDSVYAKKAKEEE